jgi:DNA-binding NarL/FixJ family response regulator
MTNLLVPALSHCRLLVVENNRETRAWIAESLKSAFAGANVTAVGTFAEAQRLLFCRDNTRRDFDIALLDIALPDGNGIDLVRRMSIYLPGTMPIMLTSVDDDANLFDALSAGAMGYILKSAKAAHLIEQLKRIDHNEPPISSRIAHRILAYFRISNPAARSDIGLAAATNLTNREIEVLRLLGKGLTSAEIAGILGFSQNTCATHIKAIYRKLNVSSRAEAAIEADRRGLV